MHFHPAGAQRRHLPTWQFASSHSRLSCHTAVTLIAVASHTIYPTLPAQNNTSPPSSFQQLVGQRSAAVQTCPGGMVWERRAIEESCLHYALYQAANLSLTETMDCQRCHCLYATITASSPSPAPQYLIAQFSLLACRSGLCTSQQGPSGSEEYGI